MQKARSRVAVNPGKRNQIRARSSVQRGKKVVRALKQAHQKMKRQQKKKTGKKEQRFSAKEKKE
jgi:hypothetical protein